ncbi:MAG: rRNA adenine N-6-methyltransferase family protein [Nanoarchaeota archaeon]
MSWVSFLIESLKHPFKVGALTPSSPHLVKAMLAPVDWTTVKTVVEFGPGTGVMTRGILRRMRPDAKLVAYELNKKFIEKLTGTDARLTIKQQSAELMTEKPDVIISSLPLAAMPSAVVERILTRATIAKVFVQFQYTQKLETRLAQHFTYSRRWIAKNIPPAHAYVCRPRKTTTRQK